LRLDDDKPEAFPPPTGEVVEIHPDELEPAPDVARDPGEPAVLGSGEPLACMLQVDCLMDQVENVANAPSAVVAPVLPPDMVPGELPPAA
jgi:hypothetical protein